MKVSKCESFTAIDTEIGKFFIVADNILKNYWMNTELVNFVDLMIF